MLLTAISVCLVPINVYASDDGAILNATATAIEQICKPIIIDGVSFDGALQASTAPFEDESRQGEKAAFLAAGGPDGVFVSQPENSPRACAILFGVPDAPSVKPAVEFVLGVWGCPASDVAIREGNTFAYNCPSATVRLDIFESDEEIALSFRFN